MQVGLQPTPGWNSPCSAALWEKQGDQFPDECEKYLDTCELMTRVMSTHSLTHRIASPMILHFFSVSYDDRWMESKNERCQKMLAEYRAMGN